MSIREQIATLEELSATDEEIRRLDEALEKHQKGLSGMRSEVKALDERLRVDREMLTSMERTRADLAIEVRQMTQQIEKSREKLSRSRNEREQMAAQREMEELRKLLRDREEEVERVTGAMDQAKASILDAEKKVAAIRAQLEGTQEGITTQIGELEASRKSRAEGRTKLVTKLPSILFRRYESIRTRRPVAIARTTDGTCMGCHIGVAPMMFQKMRRQEEFEQCPNCKRILYYMAADAPAASEPSR